MAQRKFITSEDGHIVGTHSWVDGFRPVKRPARRITEDDALAHALLLARLVSEDAADEYLDGWCSGRVVLFNVK